MDDPSQLSFLLEQTRLHSASIATLTSKVDELTSSVARLSAESASQATTIAHLSSENAQLRAAQRNQHQVNAELLGKVFEDGVMLWEGSNHGEQGTKSDQGKWVWSTERYKLVTPVGRVAPNASLLSLPVELLQMVLDPLPPEQQPSLCLVCYRLLGVVSLSLYHKFPGMHWEQAFGFICNRLEDLNKKSARISTVLLPKAITLSGEAPDYLDEWVNARLAPGSPATFKVTKLFLHLESIDSFAGWAPLLAHVDPQKVAVYTGSPNPHHRVRPTIHRLDSFFLIDEITAFWTRLDQVFARGPASVLLSPGSGPARLAFVPCLRRCSGRSSAQSSVRMFRQIKGEAEAQKQVLVEGELTKLRARGSQAEQGETLYTLSVMVA